MTKILVEIGLRRLWKFWFRTIKRFSGQRHNWCKICGCVFPIRQGVEIQWGVDHKEWCWRNA